MLASLAAALALGAAAGMPLASGSASPSGDSVPANLLRIELRFDRPLGDLDMRFVNLFDGAGERIDDALLDIALPERGGRGAAVLMHPGRIKNGVGPNLAAGPALREGDSVTLVVDDPRLPHAIRKTWRIAAAVRSAIAPAAWKVDVPKAGGRGALTIALPSAINAGAVDLIAVAAGDGNRVSGKARLGAGETAWRFVPSSNWKAGAYAVRIHPTLEDPAGNRLCSAFEQAAQSAQQCDDEARIDFRIAPADARGRSAK